MITRRILVAFLLPLAVSAFAPVALSVERARFDQTAFLAALDAGGPVLVDVHASWCTTCRAQLKAMKQLFRKPEYQDFRVFVVDYDTEKDIMRALGASQRSTLIVFKGGAERGRVVGDTSTASIEALLQTGL